MCRQDFEDDEKWTAVISIPFLNYHTQHVNMINQRPPLTMMAVTFVLGGGGNNRSSCLLDLIDVR